MLHSPLITRTMTSLFAAALFVGGFSTAHAVPLTFAYEGTVNVAEGDTAALQAAADAFLGATLFFQYTFESTTPDTNLSASTGTYAAPIAFFVTVLGNTYLGGTGTITVDNNLFGLFDSYFVRAQAAGIAGPPLVGAPPDNLVLAFFDLTSTAFSSDTLPITPPDPADFPPPSVPRLVVEGEDGGGNEWNITATQVRPAAPIPEPTTMLLLGSGLAGLLAWRMRKGRA